jgi:hypothetical protein
VAPLLLLLEPVELLAQIHLKLKAGEDDFTIIPTDSGDLI